MESRQIILAGIGMGSGDVITEEVRQLIEEADCLIGAERMITSAQKIRSMNGLSMRQCERNNRNEGVFIKEYRTEEIVSYIKEHKEHSKIEFFFREIQDFIVVRKTERTIDGSVF